MKNRSTKLFLNTFIFIVGVVSMECVDPNNDKNDEPTHTMITSGRVNTNTKFSFSYGRVEASIKLPKTANGLWPAFWLLGSDFSTIGWPQCGEIDVLEMGNKIGITNNTQERYFSGATHWGSIHEGNHPTYAVANTCDYSLQDDAFHTYTLLWDTVSIKMYLDANPIPYYVINIEDVAVRDYFHKPYFLIFNLAVGGDFPQLYDINQITALNASNNYEASLYIDYIKIYDASGTIVWEDTFDAKTLDPTKWNIEENAAGGGNHELQVYRRQNVSIGIEKNTNKSCLMITAKKQ
jgi:beta-glucanase (GH16 family)